MNSSEIQTLEKIRDFILNEVLDLNEDRQIREEEKPVEESAEDIWDEIEGVDRIKYEFGKNRRN